MRRFEPRGGSMHIRSRSLCALALATLMACGGSAPPKSASPARAAYAKAEAGPAKESDGDGVMDDKPSAAADESSKKVMGAPPPPPPPQPGPNPTPASAQTTEEPARDPAMIVYTAHVT